jgi:hypothetical protein
LQPDIKPEPETMTRWRREVEKVRILRILFVVVFAGAMTTILWTYETGMWNPWLESPWVSGLKFVFDGVLSVGYIAGMIVSGSVHDPAKWAVYATVFCEFAIAAMALSLVIFRAPGRPDNGRVIVL